MAQSRQSLQAKRDRQGRRPWTVGLEPNVPRGTYFKDHRRTSAGLCRRRRVPRWDLPERCGVVAILHQVFYDRVEAGRPYVRWAFCKADDVLDEAIRRLGRLTEARSLALAEVGNRVESPQ